jgi:hypothetical protein
MNDILAKSGDSITQYNMHENCMVNRVNTINTGKLYPVIRFGKNSFRGTQHFKCSADAETAARAFLYKLQDAYPYVNTKNIPTVSCSEMPLTQYTFADLEFHYKNQATSA